jgi:nucleoside-diphosphate-sugar epimerase
MRAPLAGTRLADDTGFRPRFGLAEGIAEFVTWLRAHPESLT